MRMVMPLGVVQKSSVAASRLQMQRLTMILGAGEIQKSATTPRHTSKHLLGHHLIRYDHPHSVTHAFPNQALMSRSACLKDSLIINWPDASAWILVSSPRFTRRYSSLRSRCNRPTRRSIRPVGYISRLGLLLNVGHGFIFFLIFSLRRLLLVLQV